MDRIEEQIRQAILRNPELAKKYPEEARRLFEKKRREYCQNQEPTGYDSFAKVYDPFRGTVEYVKIEKLEK